MRRSTRCLLVVAVLSCVITPLLGAGSRAIVVDSDGRALVVVDLASGVASQKLQLVERPYRVITSSDGKTAAVLIRGAGEKSFWQGRFKPTVKSSVIVADAEAMKQVGRADIGWDVSDAMFGSDGMLYVLSPGYAGKKPNETLPAELFKIDPGSGGVVKRLSFDSAANGFDLAGDGKTGIVYIEGNDKQNIPAEFRFVDLATFDAATAVKLSADAASPASFSADPYVYSLDPGDDDTNGKMWVLSTSDRSATSLEVGRNAKVVLADADNHNLYILSSNEKSKQGFLHVIKGMKVDKTVTLDFNPIAMQLSADGKGAYVAGYTLGGRSHTGRLTRIDLGSGTVGQTVELSIPSIADFRVTADEKRAVVLHGDEQWCCSASVSDLTAGKQLTAFQTGSKGKRIAQALGSVALTAASYQAGRGGGASSFTYTIYSPRTYGVARGPLLMRPDGKFAYALDSQTDYLTTIEMESGQRVANFGAGSGAKELILLGDRSTLAIVSDEAVTLVDTQKNEKRDQVKLRGDVRDFILSPDGRYAILLGKQKLVVMDAQTGKVISDAGSLTGPSQVIFY